MKCDCGYNAFYYQWFYEGKRYDVYKCGYAMIDSKKRTKCDLLVCNYISDIKEISSRISKKTVKLDEKNNTNAEKTYKDELIRFIHLSQITKNFSKKYRANYIANINFLLNKLNFKLYFEETETLESLKCRISENCVAKPRKKNNLPIKLVEYPDHMTVNKKCKPVRKQVQNKKSIVKNKSNLLIDEDEENTEEKKHLEEILFSESESDEDEEDNTFDVDNYDSGDDYEDFDDGGAFSD